MGQIRKLTQLFIMAQILQASMAVRAFDMGNDYYNVSGFATLGITSSGKDDVGFHRDLERKGVFSGERSFESESSLGLQLDFFATDSFGGAIQYVLKDRVQHSLEDGLEWAFLRYQPHQNWSIRAGKIGYDTFMLSEYRNVGFAYLWSRPPAEFYTIITFPSFKGADIAWSTDLGEGTLRVKAFTGETGIEAKLVGMPISITLKDVIGANIGWESERWRIRFSASFNHLGEEGDYFVQSAPLANGLLQVAPLWPEAPRLANDLVINDNRINYYALGLAYTDNPWQVQTEVSYSDSKLNAFSSQMAGYVSVGYQIDSITPYVVLATAKTEGDPVIVADAPVIPFSAQLTAQLAELQYGTQFLYDSFRVEQDGISLGLRWDIRYDMAIKAQWDHSRPKRHGFAIWEQKQSPAKSHAINTLSINWNVVF